MPCRVTVAQIESIPTGVDVCHVDELSEPARECLFRVVREGDPVAAEPEVATEIASYDVVKFTRYYRLSLVNRKRVDARPCDCDGPQPRT